MTGVDSLVGKKIRWTFVDGPMPETSFEHTFNEDGSVVWKILDGPMQGASAKEKQCAVVAVAKDVRVVSYLGASGHTLTVVLNFETKRMFGFASNEKEWQSLSGTFEAVA